MLRAIASNTVKLAFNILNVLCPSSIVRAKLFKLFGASVGRGAKIERISLMHYEGGNLGNLVIGERVFIGPGTIIDIKDTVVIGDSVKIASGCNISTHADCGKENAISELYPPRTGKVIIGGRTWIGLSTTILCGVMIGSDSVVGACSLVTRDIPSGVLAFGVPAKVRKTLFGSLITTTEQEEPS
ncbi:MAG TPA: acyltransferase [Dissulfurispiraceae bacterium]